MNTSPPRCPRCKATIPADAPLGLCPTCVLSGAALASEAGSRPRTALEIPPIESVRAAFPQLEILELVGSGGMGVVYHARQPQLDRHVALKILPQSLGTDPAFAERFNREARFLARLSHPNIVAVHDFGQSHGFCYLLMEFVDGVNLREAMRSGRFSPAEALALIPGICDALQYAHSQGVLHRDIKPENLLLDAHGRVRIVDFGVAKLVGEDARDITLTVPGARVGTPHYMAPEQVEKPSDVDHRADIYSLGVVLYELLTGELPLGRFAAPSAKAWLDARVDAIVLRALAKERELRQQSADEVKADVEGLGKVRSEPPTPSTKPQSRWGNGRLLGITVLRPGTTGPKLDWPGLGTAWLGLAALLLPLGWGLVITTFGSMLAQRLVLTTGLVLGLVCPGLLAAFVAFERQFLRPAGTAANPVPNPPPEWARLTGWALLLWAFAWTGIGLVTLHDPNPGTIRRIDLGGEWMLLPAVIVLWTGHAGWRRLATIHGALILGTMIVGGISAALVHPASPEMTPSSARSIGNTVAFVGSLLALWAPALSSRFLPAKPWIPIPWRRRLSVVLLVLAFCLTAGSALQIAFQRPRYISTATLEWRSTDPYADWIVASETCIRDFPATTVSLEFDPPSQSSTNASIRRRISANAPTPDEALNALNAVLKAWWEAPAGDAPRVLEDPTTPIAARSPFKILIAAAWAALLLGLPALYLRQPHPIPPQRMFRTTVIACTFAVLVDAARQILT
jgi:serine/threonine protein kinase